MEAQAKAFATYHHAAVAQTRKYTGEPYIHHPAAVAEIVRRVPHTPAMIAAAWLHDTVEDTAATLDQVQVRFGTKVATLVEMLTNVSTLADGDRATRKAIDRAHTAQASPAAQTIKLADVIDNSHDIVARDPKFAAVYLDENRLLLEVLTRGDADLWSWARAIVVANTPALESL